MTCGRFDQSEASKSKHIREREREREEMIMCGTPQPSKKGFKFISLQSSWFGSFLPSKLHSAITNDLHYRKIRRASIFPHFPPSHFIHPQSILFSSISLHIDPTSFALLFLQRQRKYDNEMRKFSDPWNDKSRSLTRIDDTEIVTVKPKFCERERERWVWRKIITRKKKVCDNLQWL